MTTPIIPRDGKSQVSHVDRNESDAELEYCLINDQDTIRFCWRRDTDVQNILADLTSKTTWTIEDLDSLIGKLIGMFALTSETELKR